MSVNVPKQLPLRDPRSFHLPIDKPLLDYLVELNEWLQNLNRSVRDALVSRGLSGTEVLDDGANWRVTRVYDHGRLTAQTVAATSGVAGASWTAA